MPDQSTAPRLGKHAGQWVVVIGKGKNRQRFRTGVPYGAATRGDAERALRQVEAQLIRAVGDTIEDVYPAYLIDRNRSKTSRQSWSWKRLAPFWTGIRITQITRDLCRKYTAQRRDQGVKDGTIRGELTDLKSAVRWKDRNAGTFELPMQPAPRDRWLTREEFTRLLTAAQDTPHLELYLHLAIATAARQEAILDLRWEPAVGGPGHVDLDKGEVFLGYKANGKKRARVPINTTLDAALRHAKGMAATGHVIEFRGAPVASIKTGFNAAVKRAGIAHCTRHDLRHTAAVWMAADGRPMSRISQFLGHSSTAVTERIYARYAPDHLMDEAKSLEV